MWDTCMSFNPKSHTSNPTHNLAPVTSSYSHQFPISHRFSIYNQAVPDLPCSPCMIRQFPTSYVLAQSTIKHAVIMFDIHSPLSPMWNTYMSLKHPANHPSPVLSPSLSNTSMKLGALAQHLRKKKKSATSKTSAALQQFLLPYSCYTGNPIQVRNSYRCVHASTLTITK